MRNLNSCAVLALAFLIGVAPADGKTAKKAPVADPSAAESPAVLGTFKDWSAYSRGSGEGKVCYALAEPRSKAPDTVKRDPAYFLINDWPGRHARAESEVVPGYRYQDGSTVTVEIGRDKFVFFTKNDATSGSAWVLNPIDDAKLLKAMRGGSTAIVTGISRRGTKTTDTYGLSGVSDAIARIHDACGL
jgi:hypothetical protein